jgi:hypothetical protein
MKLFKSALISLVTLFSFSSNAAFINFNDYTTSAFNNQYVSGTATASTDGSTLTLDGNLWVSISDLFEVSSDTVLYFTLEATGPLAEWYGIGFDDNNSVTPTNNFQLGGTQTSRSNQYATYSPLDGAVNFAINLGDFYTATFDRMVFILDADNVAGTTVSFSNVELCSTGDVCLSTAAPSAPTSVSAPAAGSIMLMSLCLIFLGRKKF